MQEDSNLTMEELIESKKYTKVSFMIFRTGSGLIVGNCSENVLMHVYDFIKNNNDKHIIIEGVMFYTNYDMCRKLLQKMIENNEIHNIIILKECQL